MNGIVPAPTRVAVVSEGFAKRLLKGNALGRRIQISSADGAIEIVASCGTSADRHSDAWVLR